MHRFFIPPNQLTNGELVITDEQAHQIVNVIRLKQGDRITALDNGGKEYEIVLVDITRDWVKGEILSQHDCTSEPAIQITLYQALLKKDRFEYALQKCTEIGVTRFVPIISERCVAAVPSDARIERWRSIIRETAEQSNRGKLPVLDEVVSFEQACRETKGFAIIPWEELKSNSLKSVIDYSNSPQYDVFIGPEGGYPYHEVERAQNHGVIPVTMGKRLLRAETAGLVAAAIILNEYDDLG